MHRELLGNSRCIFYRMTDKQFTQDRVTQQMWIFLSALPQILFPIHERRQSILTNRNIYSSLDQRAGIADKVFGDIGAVFCDPFHRDRLFLRCR